MDELIDPEIIQAIELYLQQRGQGQGQNGFDIHDPTQPDFATDGNFLNFNSSGNPIDNVTDPNQGDNLNVSQSQIANSPIGNALTSFDLDLTEQGQEQFIPNTGTAETSTSAQRGQFRDPSSILKELSFGTSPTNSVFSLGQSLAFDSSGFGNSPEQRQRAKRGNTTRLIGAAGSTLLDLARTGFAGAAFQRRNQQTLSEFQRSSRRGIIGNFQTLKDGGTIGDGPSISVEQMMTGDVITGLPSFSLQEPNAEIEHDEFIMNPDSSVQKVVGKTHDKGGEKVILEDGTDVVSNNLKLGKNNAKYLKDNYNLKVKANGTYASALHVYNKESGLDKLNIEQEKLFKKLREQESLEDNVTSKLNHEFLSEKINDLEKQKEPLEKARTKLFQEIFMRQQEDKEDQDNTQNFSEGGTFKIDDVLLTKMAERNNISIEKARELIETFRGGGTKRVKKFENGNDTDPKNPFIKRKNKFNDPSKFVGQSASAKGFGEVDEETFLERIQNLNNGFPLIVMKNFDLKYDNEGNLVDATVKDGASIEQFQKEIDNNYKLLIDDVSNRIEDPTQRENFINQIGIERFNNQVARGFDNKFGNFTSSRPNFGFELLTPGDFKKIQDKGITTFQQLLDENGDFDSTLNLSDKSMENLSPFKGTQANFLVGEVTPIEGDPVVSSQPTGTTEAPQESDLNINSSRFAGTGGLPFLPDQSALSPEGIDPQLRVNRRFDRIEPVKVSPDQALSEIFREESAAFDQINELPGSQRTAAITNIAANTQQVVNKAVSNANTINAQNQFNADQINLQQSNAEENARAADLLDFERRQLTGKAITIENINNFFDYNRKVRLGDFNTIQKFNALNSIFENFDISPFGTVERNQNSTAFYNPLAAEVSDPIEYSDPNIITNRQTS